MRHRGSRAAAPCRAQARGARRDRGQLAGVTLGHVLSYVHESIRDRNATIGRADAFIFVVPEYSYGFNAAIKNAIDYLNAGCDYLNAEWRHHLPIVQQPARPAGPWSVARRR
ncbi:MAG: NADPH-dependent FMN reductase [Streptosporangiaceae bacterium]|nr:hypothetical protein [Actinomycetota bacterium]